MLLLLPMLRLLSIALMLASGSSFTPSLKTQLAARRPPPTPARVVPPAMVFQPPWFFQPPWKWRQNNDERRLVCPHPFSVPFLDSCTRSLKDAPFAPLARAAPDMHDTPLPCTTTPFHARQPPSIHDNPPSMHDNPLPCKTTPFHARQPPPSREPAPIICVSATNTSISQTPPLSPPASRRYSSKNAEREKNSERSSASPSAQFWVRLRPSCSRCDAESLAPPEACTWRVCTGGSVVRESAPRLARRVLCAQCTRLSGS